MELVTARYLTRFRCLGAACEDHCCHDWKVIVDQKHYDRLHERMTSEAERAELAAGIKKLDHGAPNRYALMVLGDDGNCRFLDRDALCSIHARYGEELLPDACATYPRVLGRIGTRVELIASPSCPEVARLVLLRDDGIQAIPGTPALYGRGLISRKIEANADDPYESSFLAVRGLVADLLQRRRYPMASRLFFVAFFADRARAQLRRGAESFDANALQQLGRSLQADDALDALHEQYASFAVEGPFAIAVVRTLLRLPAELVPRPLQIFVEQLGPGYAARGATLDGDPDALHRAYLELPPLPAELADRLELIVERYAVHHLLREWYVKSDTFIGYVHDLLARVAIIRFLIGSQARLQGPLDAGAFDALAVRVVYLVSRVLEHNSDLVRRLIRGLEAQGMDLARAVCLARV